MPGGTLVVSRAKNLFPYYKRRLLDLGFSNVEITGEEKDSLNMVIHETKPRLVLVGSGFYHAGTPYMMGRLLKSFPKLNIAAVSLGEFPDSLAVWFVWHGVRSYLNFWDGETEFFEGLEELRNGRPHISRNVLRLLGQLSITPDVEDRATKRHLEVLVLLCKGHLIQEIGSLLHISRNTVNAHLKHMCKIFHARGREEMVSMAWELGLVTTRDCFYPREKDNGGLPEWAAAKQKASKMR
ncbi:MAG: LuxR C-terminal-related transcriptional regulator [Treponema sp.]|nr:LuxR C-terminal-related transcriptional regulator [Treponema sp.]